MSRCLFALLVGINNYPDPRHRLDGCVNDMEGWISYLEAYSQKAGYEFHPLILRDEEATRQNVIAGFTNHLTQAKHGDVAVFFFAGHGSHIPGQAVFNQTPEETNQTLVCWDSRAENSWDLVDKELSNLVAAVAEKEPQITLILDCCHSGSGSRPWEEPFKERCIEPQWVVDRPNDSYFRIASDVARETLTERVRLEEKGEGTTFELRKGRHILLAACHETQTSKEMRMENASRGVFSFFMQQILARATRPMTYTELLIQVQHEIKQKKVPEQLPQLEVIKGKEGDTQCYFLSREMQVESGGLFTLFYKDDRAGWVVDGGGIHGWPESKEDVGIELAIFPFADAPKAIKQMIGQVGIAWVQEVKSTFSRVSVESQELNPRQLYKALVTRCPTPDVLTVHLQGNKAGVETLRRSLLELDERLVRACEVRERSTAMVVLNAKEKEYEIFRGAALRESMKVPVAVKRYCPPISTDIHESLVRIRRWLELRDLSQAKHGAPAAASIELVLFHGLDRQEGRDIELLCNFCDGQWLVSDLQFHIRNKTSSPIYCALLSLSPEFGIDPDVVEAGILKIGPGEVGKSIEFDLEIPKRFMEKGLCEYPNIFRLVASSQEFNGRVWSQPGLEQTERKIIPREKHKLFWTTKEVVVRCIISENNNNEKHTSTHSLDTNNFLEDEESLNIAELWEMDEELLLILLGQLVERSPVVTERPLEMVDDLGVRSPVVTERPISSINNSSGDFTNSQTIHESDLLNGKRFFNKFLDETDQLLTSYLIGLTH